MTNPTTNTNTTTTNNVHTSPMMMQRVQRLRRATTATRSPLLLRKFVTPKQSASVAANLLRQRQTLNGPMKRRSDTSLSNSSSSNNSSRPIRVPPSPQCRQAARTTNTLRTQQQQQSQPKQSQGIGEQQQQQQQPLDQTVAELYVKIRQKTLSSCRPTTVLTASETQSLHEAIISAFQSSTGEIEPNLLLAAIEAGLSKDTITDLARHVMAQKAAKQKVLEANAVAQLSPYEWQQRLQTRLSKRIEHLETVVKHQDVQLHHGTCVICLDAPRTHVFIPCGHVCTCRSCSNALIGQTPSHPWMDEDVPLVQCPICKQAVQQIIPVFHP